MPEIKNPKPHEIGKDHPLSLPELSQGNTEPLDCAIVLFTEKQKANNARDVFLCYVEAERAEMNALDAIK